MTISHSYIVVSCKHIVAESNSMLYMVLAVDFLLVFWFGFWYMHNIRMT